MTLSNLRDINVFLRVNDMMGNIDDRKLFEMHAYIWVYIWVKESTTTAVKLHINFLILLAPEP